MDWSAERFGDVCDFVRGPFGGSLKKNMFKEEGYAVYEQQHAIYDQFSSIRYFIDDDKFAEMSRFELSPGDLIMSCSGTMGKIAIVPFGIKKGIINQALLKLTPNDMLLPKFLKLWMESRSFQEQIASLSQGVAIKNMASVKILKEITVPTPELSEQHRIVAILDQAFSDIEKARANAEQNLKNASELFDSYLQQVFSQRGAGWASSQLKDITSKIGSGATPRGGKESYKVAGTPLIRSMNVHDRRFVEKNLAFIDDEQATKLNNVIVEDNDVLLNITGASVARCCVAHEDFLPARVNQHVSIIRVDKTMVLPQFLNFLLTSKFYKDQLLGIGEAGSTRQAITKAQIENFTVDYPNRLSAQIDLLEGLFSLENQILEVQKIYKTKLNSLDELKKSLLQKAFSGELTKSKGIAA